MLIIRFNEFISDLKVQNFDDTTILNVQSVFSSGAVVYESYVVKHWNTERIIFVQSNDCRPEQMYVSVRIVFA